MNLTGLQLINKECLFRAEVCQMFDIIISQTVFSGCLFKLGRLITNTDIMMKLGREESAGFHLDFKERCGSVE